MRLVKDDLFATDALALGQGVNCYGVMGAGIAVKFRQLDEHMYQEYYRLCHAGGLQPGDLFPWQLQDGRWVYNMASQRKPGKDARLEWLAPAATKALNHAEAHDIPLVAIPLIGCGIGGLQWEDVEASLRQVERNRSSEFLVYRP